MKTDSTQRQPRGIPAGGQFSATTHAEPTLTLKPASSSKGVRTTVTLPDGGVATRTSKNGNYTHAVVLSPEVPELVIARHEESIKTAEAEIALVDPALENPVVKLRNRRLSSPGEDPDVSYNGEPSYTGFEAIIYAPDSKVELASTWANSKGVTAHSFDFDTDTWEANKPQKVHAYLKSSLRSKRKMAVESIAKSRAIIEQVKDGSYDLGTYQVARWSSRADLAEKAARSEFPVTGGTRNATVVPVD